MRDSFSPVRGFNGRSFPPAISRAPPTFAVPRLSGCTSAGLYSAALRALRVFLRQSMIMASELPALTMIGQAASIVLCALAVTAEISKNAFHFAPRSRVRRPARIVHRVDLVSRDQFGFVSISSLYSSTSWKLSSNLDRIRAPDSSRYRQGESTPGALMWTQELVPEPCLRARLRLHRARRRQRNCGRRKRHHAKVRRQRRERVVGNLRLGGEITEINVTTGVRIATRPTPRATSA